MIPNAASASSARSQCRARLSNMSVLSRKISYKKIIDDLAHDAFHTSLTEMPGLNSPPDELGGYMQNSLESVAAIFFLLERSLSSLSDENKCDKAKEHLASIVLRDLRASYSSDEMKNFVIPMLENRSRQYHSILDGQGEPGPKILNLGIAMIGKFIDDDVSLENKALASTVLFNNLCVEPAKKIKALDESNHIRW